MISYWIHNILYRLNPRTDKQNIELFRSLVLYIKNIDPINDDPYIAQVVHLLRTVDLSSGKSDVIAMALDTIYSVFDNENIRQDASQCKLKLTGKAIKPVSLDRIVVYIKLSVDTAYSQIVN